MKVIIVGGGKIGYYLAQMLIEHGHQPCIIEQDRSVCVKIANEIEEATVICADGTTIEGLTSAGIEHASALVSVTGKDECNLICCQLAKKLFHIPKTVARVNNPKNAQLIKQLGVDIVINSTISIVSLLEREVDSAAIKNLVTLNSGEASISEIQLPENYLLSGTKLMNLKIPEGIIIISITRDGKLIIPRGNTVVQSSDRLMILADNLYLHDIPRFFKI